VSVVCCLPKDKLAGSKFVAESAVDLFPLACSTAGLAGSATFPVGVGVGIGVGVGAVACEVGVGADVITFDGEGEQAVIDSNNRNTNGLFIGEAERASSHFSASLQGSGMYRQIFKRLPITSQPLYNS
jgi:hypothetical protein